ncbi:MAG: 1-deoxy-D-xylulose-5-phosphate synthase [Gemmatimonadaceae bacterium]|nr:1-deoxy-D-xylulose-5-phosphate synthase [Caulobacter sp.]
MKFRIMYIEDKSKGLNGPARIGRVRLSKTGETLYYAGRAFEALRNSGLKANFTDVDTGHPFWIAKARKDGGDRLFKGAGDPPVIDDDVREDYWRDVRGMPDPDVAG